MPTAFLEILMESPFFPQSLPAGGRLPHLSGAGENGVVYAGANMDVCADDSR